MRATHVASSVRSRVSDRQRKSAVWPHACLCVQAVLVAVEGKVLGSKRCDVGQVCEGDLGSCYCQAYSPNTCSEQGEPSSL